MKVCSLTALCLASVVVGWPQGGVPVILSGACRAMRLTMYVGSDRVLVRETCSVFLPAGESEVSFRWSDADIDPAEITLDGGAEVRIGGARQPPGEPKCVVWPVEVDRAGARDLTASYFLKGLSWSATYELVYDAASGKAHLVGKLHLSNDARLPLRGARVELCVAPAGVLDKLDQAEGLQRVGTYAVVENVSLESGWQRRTAFLDAPDLPARVVYRADPEAFGQEVRKFLLVDLRQVAVPGTLPRGHLELYELTEGQRVWLLSTDLVPAADRDTEIALGREPNIVFQRKLLDWRKSEVQFDRLGRVSGYDTAEEVCDAFTNRLAFPVQVELVERVPGKWEFQGRVEPTTRAANEVKWDVSLARGEHKEITYKVIRHLGSRAG